MEPQVGAESARAARGVMAVMGKEGDTKYTWDKDNPAEVAIAKKVFDSYRKDKYLAFKMSGESRGEMMTEFDPSAEKILFAPAMVGG